MTINATPDLALSSSDDLTCTETDVRVSVAAADAAATYTWDFAGATVTDLADEAYSLSWPAAGTYTVSVEVNRSGCTNSASTTISVEAPVSAGSSVAEDLLICAGSSDVVDLGATLAGETPGGAWSVIAGGVAGGSLDAATGTLSPAALSAGAYSFAYTVPGGACPDAMTQVDLTILGAPLADAGAGQRLTCNMGMVSLNGSNSETGEGYTYLWTSDNPNAVIMDADRMMIDVSQPGTYTLRVTNAIGCTATSDVVVTAETEAPVMEIDVSQITCFSSDNGAISVTNVSGGRPPYTYTLNGEDRGQSTLFAGLEPIEYDLQITDANGCFSNILLDITEPNELTVSLRFPGDSTTFNAGDNIFISATVNGGNAIDTLIWEPDSLVTTDGQNGISFIADETRMISVTVVDELGCTATDQMMLLVRRNRPVYLPTAFSPNGDNINDIFFIGGDLDQIDYIDNFLIFDRWGEALFNSNQVDNGGNSLGDGTGFLPNDPAFGWDGLLNGGPMNPQVLVYTLTVHFSDGEVIVYKGDFVLMR
jgi:PKD repeat protein